MRFLLVGLSVRKLFEVNGITAELDDVLIRLKLLTLDSDLYDQVRDGIQKRCIELATAAYPGMGFESCGLYRHGFENTARKLFALGSLRYYVMKDSECYSSRQAMMSYLGRGNASNADHRLLRLLRCDIPFAVWDYEREARRKLLYETGFDLG